MEVRRNNLFYDIAYWMTTGPLRLYHKIEIEGSENIPKKGPALILPKHIVLRDGLVEGYFLKKAANRRGNWIGKYSLSRGLSLCGLVSIMRGSDYRAAGIPRGGADEFNEKAKEYIRFLYISKEIVIIHPEGTRMPRRVGRFSKELIEFTREVSREDGIEIPVIPMGIKYETLEWTGVRSRITISAGKPLDIKTDNLVDTVREEVRRLSGFIV